MRRAYTTHTAHQKSIFLYFLFESTSIFHQKTGSKMMISSGLSCTDTHILRLSIGHRHHIYVGHSGQLQPTFSYKFFGLSSLGRKLSATVPHNSKSVHAADWLAGFAHPCASTSRNTIVRNILMLLSRVAAARLLKYARTSLSKPDFFLLYSTNPSNLILAAVSGLL